MENGEILGKNKGKMEKFWGKHGENGEILGENMEKMRKFREIQEKLGKRWGKFWGKKWGNSVRR